MKDDTSLIGLYQSAEIKYPEIFKRKSAYMGENSRVGLLAKQEFRVLQEISCPFGQQADYIVILGPAYVNGVLVEMALRLEIGLNRSVPYRQFEFRTREKVRAIKDRTHIPLSEAEVLSLLPQLANVIQRIVDERVLAWKKVHHTVKQGKHMQRYYKGLFFTVEKSEEILAYAFLLRNRICRNRDFLARLAGFVSTCLGGMRYASYSDKELRSYKGTKAIAGTINGRYTASQIATVQGMLGNPSKSKDRALFDEILRVFNIKFRQEEEYEKAFRRLDKKYARLKPEISKVFALDVATHPKRDKRRKTHAQNCYRFEVQPSQRIKNGEIFRRLDENGEDEIPF